MATRSTIAVQHTSGVVSESYCHWDGYPSHNGKILLEHYNTLEKVEQLVELGSMSSLGETCIPNGTHDFDNPQKGVTVYYGRDRGETDTEPKQYLDLEDYKARLIGEEYDYLFTNGQWLISAYGRGFEPLTEEMVNRED